MGERWKAIRDQLLREDLEWWRNDKMRTMGWTRERAEKESRLRSDRVPSAAGALEAACKRIAELEAERRWISEEEQKPSCPALVLVDCRGVVGTGYYYQHLDDWAGTPNGRRPNFWKPIPLPESRSAGGQL